MERYARDTDRISALNRMETGLAVYWADAGRYPMPEGDISTGSIEGSVRAYLGTFGEAVAQNLKMGGVPTDPLSGFRYVYAVDARQREYQIMAMLESSITYTFLLTGIASVSPEIRIIGNYS